MAKLTYKSACAVLAVILAMLCLTGCEPAANKYYGPNVDCFTIAANNILGLSPLFCQTALLDEDSYGRQIFVYLGGYPAPPGGADLLAVLISQKADEKYVYYYPDDCFILYEKSLPYYTSDEEMVSAVKAMVPAADLQALEEKNDWGKPFDESRCAKKVISRTNDRGRVTNSSMLKFYRSVGYVDPYSSIQYFTYMTSDDYNRQIYFSRLDDAGKNYIGAYAVMFSPGGRINSMKITDFLHYQDAMKEFKIKNNWNKPLT